MTKLRAVLVRETEVLHRGEPIVVELSGRVLYLRVKGKRAEAVSVGYGELFEHLLLRDARAKLRRSGNGR